MAVNLLGTGHQLDHFKTGLRSETSWGQDGDDVWGFTVGRGQTKGQGGLGGWLLVKHANTN